MSRKENNKSPFFFGYMETHRLTLTSIKRLQELQGLLRKRINCTLAPPERGCDQIYTVEGVEHLNGTSSATSVCEQELNFGICGWRDSNP